MGSSRTILRPHRFANCDPVSSVEGIDEEPVVEEKGEYTGDGLEIYEIEQQTKEVESVDEPMKQTE